MFEKCITCKVGHPKCERCQAIANLSGQFEDPDSIHMKAFIACCLLLCQYIEMIYKLTQHLNMRGAPHFVPTCSPTTLPLPIPLALDARFNPFKIFLNFQAQSCCVRAAQAATEEDTTMARARTEHTAHRAHSTQRGAQHTEHVHSAQHIEHTAQHIAHSTVHNAQHTEHSAHSRLHKLSLQELGRGSS